MTDYDSDTPQITPHGPDGDMLLHLPEITSLDTQVWSVDIGLTPARLAELRALLGGDAARTASGQQPETQSAATVPCGVCGNPWSDSHGIHAGDRCTPAVGQPAEAPATDRAEQAAEETPGRLAHIGWWCWRGNNHGHLADIPCRSDNVPIHVPSEWADEMRAVVQHLTDDHDLGEDCTWVTPEEQAAETQAAADTVEGER
ncbi:hypothetical protein ACFWV1_13070 [Streptomyces sp. NPDC058700]|uniref:hypothetical protein n=1 Tax=Streptomyces sp. NPDC058700 TaxID=3346607 RepID=UPI00364BEE27